MSAGPSVGVVTTVSGRRTHLRRLLEGLARQTRPADEVVVVTMDGSGVDVSPWPGARVVAVPVRPDGRLPLAAARNAGVAALRSDVVVLLDVDCVPGAGLVAGYATACAQADGLVCGEVRYLPERVPATDVWTQADLDAAARPHPARPRPAAGQLLREDRHELAWTTSIALRRNRFAALGGFDERFVGYGGEDTDFAERARTAGLGVWWTGDAVAYHQHHDSEPLPYRHLDDVVRNASLFARLHGWYPMSGWLEAFAAEGLVDYDPGRRLLAVRR